MQQLNDDSPVYLGFAQSLNNSELFRLRSHYLPLGKIGGLPSWLNPVSLPRNGDLECGVCKKPLCFLAQIYATSPNDPPHAFHRYIYVFICKDPECSKLHDASNIAIFRCQLPRENSYYLSESIDPDLEGDIPNAREIPDLPHLCNICGCHATKKCGGCLKTWYCSREHQMLDWKLMHKALCKKEDNLDENQALLSALQLDSKNSFLFPEMGTEIDQEYAPKSLLNDCCDSDSDGDENEEERRISDFKEFVEHNNENNEFSSCDFEDEEEEKIIEDPEFIRFNNFVQLNPEQILRYKRGGQPLLPTNKAPALPIPQSCQLCGGERQFELQLMPHLLSVLAVDSIEQSIDWASIFIYTCANSCLVPNNGYAKELAIKHDFVS